MIGSKIAGYLGELALDTFFINSFNRIKAYLQSGKLTDAAGKVLLDKSGLPFGIGLDDEAGFMTRASKALDHAEFINLTDFLNSLNPRERKRFRRVVVAVDFIEDKRTETTGSGEAKKVAEFVIMKDPAREFLKIISASNLNDDQRKKICESLGLLDFPLDPQKILPKINSGLVEIGESLAALGEKMEANFLPQPPDPNAKFWAKLWHRFKNS